MGIYQRQPGNYMKRPRRVPIYHCPCGTVTARGPLCVECYNTVPDCLKKDSAAAVAFVQYRLQAQSNTR